MSAENPNVFDARRGSYRPRTGESTTTDTLNERIEAVRRYLDSGPITDESERFSELSDLLDERNHHSSQEAKIEDIRHRYVGFEGALVEDNIALEITSIDTREVSYVFCYVTTLPELNEAVKDIAGTHRIRRLQSEEIEDQWLKVQSQAELLDVNLADWFDVEPRAQ